MGIVHSLKKISILIALASLTGMGCSPYLLKDNGFRGVQLGNDFESVQNLNWKAGAKRDTLFNEGGYQWRGVILETENGLVLVEESFYGEKKVNRIRVESDKFRTKFDIMVGDPVSSLQQLPGDWVLIPLPEYEKLDISSEAHPTFHFLIPWEQKEGIEEEITITDLDQTLQVVGIVIM